MKYVARRFLSLKRKKTALFAIKFVFRFRRVGRSVPQSKFGDWSADQTERTAIWSTDQTESTSHVLISTSVLVLASPGLLRLRGPLEGGGGRLVEPRSWDAGGCGEQLAGAWRRMDGSGAPGKNAIRTRGGEQESRIKKR
jgi:hypothetical protein